MGMIRCADCRHFYIPEWKRDKTFGLCRLAESGDGRPTHDDALAYALDHEGFSADLVVKPEFGCVSGEAADYIIEVHVQEYAPVKEVKINVIAPTKAEQERGI